MFDVGTITPVNTDCAAFMDARPSFKGLPQHAQRRARLLRRLYARALQQRGSSYGKDVIHIF